MPPILTLLDAMPQPEETAPPTAHRPAAEVGARWPNSKTWSRRKNGRKHFTRSDRLFIAREPRAAAVGGVRRLALDRRRDPGVSGYSRRESAARRRIFLLVNYRPGYTHTWASKDYYTRIRVDPLPPAGAKELMESLFGQP